MKWRIAAMILLAGGCSATTTPDDASASIDAAVAVVPDDAAADAPTTVLGTGACSHLRIESFMATPDTIDRGESATLSWNGVMARGCTLQPGDLAYAGGPLSQTVSPTSTTVYSLQCIGTACLDGVGAPVAQVTVTVR